MTLLYQPALWSRDQFSAVVKGVWLAGGDIDWQATGVTRRIERIQRGDLYIPSPKEREDAPHRLQLAASRGAIAVVLDQVPSAQAICCPVFKAADTSDALRQLAEASRARMNARVIAVTGSVGKTSVKDALSLALSHQASVTCNKASENDVHAIWEVLAQTPPQARYAVAELGMLGPSSIASKAAALRSRGA